MSLFDFALVKTTVESVAKGIAERRAKADGLRQQLQAIKNAPAARSEVKQAAMAWVDGQAANVGYNIRSALWHVAQSPDNLRVADRYLGAELTLLPESRGPGDTMEHRLTRLMCGLFPREVKALMAATLDAQGLPEGMPARQRATEIERLNAEITLLNDEIEQLRRQAQDAGLKLS